MFPGPPLCPLHCMCTALACSGQPSGLRAQKQQKLCERALWGGGSWVSGSSETYLMVEIHVNPAFESLCFLKTLQA